MVQFPGSNARIFPEVMVHFGGNSAPFARDVLNHFPLLDLIARRARMNRMYLPNRHIHLTLYLNGGRV